jgi:uncharacterized protein
LSSRPLSYGVALGWAVAATLLLVVVTQALVLLRPAARSDLVSLTLSEVAVYLLATFGVLRLHGGERDARAELALRPTHPGLVALGLALGLALLLPVDSLRQLVERRFPTPEAELAERAMLLSADTLVQKVLLVAAVVCAGPLVEELFFRGALFGAVRRGQAAAGAAIVTTIAFTLSHLDWRAWPSLLLVAAVLGYLRAASGSLLPCLALHVAFNGAGIAALFTGVSTVTRPMPLPAGVLIFGWLLTLALLAGVQYVADKSSRALEARAEDEP